MRLVRLSHLLETVAEEGKVSESAEDGRGQILTRPREPQASGRDSPLLDGLFGVVVDVVVVQTRCGQ